MLDLGNLDNSTYLPCCFVLGWSLCNLSLFKYEVHGDDDTLDVVENEKKEVGAVDLLISTLFRVLLKIT